MKANPFRVAVFYAMGGLTSDLLGQKPVDLDRLSPSQLVKFVTYQNRSEVFDPTLNCVATGPAKIDQEAIERLVSLGKQSMPALEKEFDAISKKGDNARYSRNIPLLLLAYARIGGTRAFPLLRAMELNQHFSFATVSLDAAIAVALGLTSYLSIARHPSRVLVACQGQQPREALDQMIVSWERGDLLWFETSLGETSARAVAVKDENEWQAFRRVLWRDAPSGAIGYRFQIIPLKARVANEEEDLDLDTAFYDRNGRSCGHMTITFVQRNHSKAPGYLRYVVDNPNITDVLQLISACTSQ